MFHIFRRRQIWIPTWQGFLIAVAALVLATWFTLANIHPFLSVTERAEGANILVVEGWVSDKILEQQFTDFQIGEPYDYGLAGSVYVTMAPAPAHGDD